MMKDPKDGRPIYNVGAEYDRTLSDEEAAKVQDIVAVCSVVLRGNAPRLVGAVLADLVSLWLAGHVPTDERGEAATYTESLRIRKAMLAWLAGLVMALLPINHIQTRERNDFPPDPTMRIDKEGNVIKVRQ